MVARQIEARGVRDPRVLAAMRAVPRERFVGDAVREFAYEDSALPIADDQTISQPYIVALMLEALELGPGDRLLEVGAGSGYAAAVAARLVDEVVAVERHAGLAERARATLGELGVENARVVHGDGTRGRPSDAPFDAVLVSAGGPRVPDALREQLAPGGRLVIPLGPPDRTQELVVFRKQEDGTLLRADLGAVRFVPLVEGGAPGPDAPAGPEAAGVRRRGRSPVGDPALEGLRGSLEAFDGVEEADLSAAVARLSGHRVVLLGEASHGTSEFYRLRARLTRELVERGEVSFVAVEADWPDAAHLDRWVRGLEDGAPEMRPFQRFPRWMWANRETLDFLRWLREHNRGIADPEARVGFFGLDLYSLHTSIEAVLAYLEDVDPETARLARDRFGCLSPWERDPATYGRLASLGRLEGCEDEVVGILTDLLERRVRAEADEGLRAVDAVANARLVADAERYYRLMYQGPTASWNVRDQHMFDTLEDLLDWHGPDAGAAVWAHNSHLGDAVATEMGAGGQHNLGQLCRRSFGDACYAVGQATWSGTVLAAHGWGEPGEVMRVRPSLEGSWGRLAHDAGAPAFFLPLRADAEARGRGELRRALAGERLQRAIGVIYRPRTERASHYFHADLVAQFDEWVFVDRTRAVEPLTASAVPPGGDPVPDTYPFAV